MMKALRFGLLVIVMTGLWTLPARAASNPLDRMLTQQTQSLPDQSFNQSINQLLKAHPQVSLPSIGQVARDLLNHQNPLNLGQLLQSWLQAVAGQLGTELRVLGLLLLLSVFAAILQRLAESMELSGVVEVAQMALISAIILVALKSFTLAVGMVESMVSGLVNLMESMIPLVVMLMAGSGALASAGIFHPLMLMTVNMVALLTRQWVLPLVLAATVVELMSYWLPHFSLANLALLFRQVGLTLLGGLMTLFLGVMAIEGAAGSVADGVVLRTGKFMVGTFVPVIGKMFSDAFEAILGSSLLLKNAVTVVGAMAIIVAVSFPLIKLLVMMFLYRVAAAATEPLAVGGVSKSLGAMANSIGWLIAVGGAVALMFFLVVTVVAGAAKGVGI